MTDIYFSADIEADGPIPGPYDDDVDGPIEVSPK